MNRQAYYGEIYLEEEYCNCPACGWYSDWHYGLSSAGWASPKWKMLYFLRHARVIRVGDKTYMPDRGYWMQIFPLAA